MFELEYRKDENLDFLEYVPGQNLIDLIPYLTKDGNGKKYVAGEFEKNTNVKIASDPHEYWQVIAAELQAFGGNSASNAVRRVVSKFSKKGTGVSYLELLDDALEYVGFKACKDMSVMDKEKLMAKRCYQVFENKAIDDVSANVFFEMAYKTWKNWSEFKDKLFSTMDKAKGLIKEAAILFIPVYSYIRIFNKFMDPKFPVTIPMILHIAGLRKKKYNIAQSNGIRCKLALGIVGMQQSGKTAFLKLLQTGKVLEDIERTATTEKYETFETCMLGTKIYGGIDIAGGDSNVTHYPEFVKDKNRMLFFFNASSYLKDSAYAIRCQARWRYIWDKIYKNRSDFEIFFVGTHIDENDVYNEYSGKEKILESISNLQVYPFAEMFTRSRNSLYVCNMKNASSDNFENYISLMKFTIGE